MHPMMKLLIDNRKKGTFKAEISNDEATIYLYDMIVSSDAEAELWGGIAPESFIKTINEVTAGTIHLRINSPGGSVFAARAMEQALREHKARVIVHIDGYAASAASFIAMAADEIEINPGGFIMIHKAWTLAFGNSDDFMQTADLLEKIDNTLVRTYAERTGKTKEEISGWMEKETWFDGEEAVKAGFADRVSGTNKEENTWNLDAYHKPPKQTEEQEVDIAAIVQAAVDKAMHDLNQNNEVIPNTDELKNRLVLSTVT